MSSTYYPGIVVTIPAEENALPTNGYHKSTVQHRLNSALSQKHSEPSSSATLMDGQNLNDTAIAMRESLIYTIESRLSKHQYSDECFCQYQERKFLLSKEEISEQLSICQLPEQKTLRILNKIWPDDENAPTFITVFILLVFLSRAQDIEKFIDCGIDDNELPLKVKKLNAVPYFHLPSDPEGEPLCFRGWVHVEKEGFKRKQWGLTAAYFAPGGSEMSAQHRIFPDEQIFPWSTSEYCRNKVEMGGYGEVTVVFMKDRHHGFHEMLQQVRYKIQIKFLALLK